MDNDLEKEIIRGLRFRRFVFVASIAVSFVLVLICVIGTLFFW